MKKVYATADDALAGCVKDGMTIMSGGFGLCGIPETLIEALRESGAGDLTVISNNAGVDGIGLGVLLESGQIKKMISSYVGENKTFAQPVSLRRARGRVHPAGHARRAHARRRRRHPGVLHAHRRRHDRRRGQGDRGSSTARPIVMETGLVATFRARPAWKGDTEGNLVYRKTARNFNPMMATAAKLTIAEVEELVEPGEIDPDHIVTPGIFVHRIVHAPNAEKRIEQRTARKTSA